MQSTSNIMYLSTPSNPKITIVYLFTDILNNCLALYSINYEHYSPTGCRNPSGQTAILEAYIPELLAGSI